MSGILPAGRQGSGAGVASPASGQRDADACLRARRAACHRPVVDAASVAVLESQAAACGVTHRHFEGRRQGSEARAPNRAGSRTPQDRVSEQQDADIALAGVESRLSATSVSGKVLIEEDLPSTVAAPVALRPHASWFVRTWHPLAARVSRLHQALQARAAAARPAPPVAARRQASAALGFREFTAPRRKPAGKPEQLRVKSAAPAEAAPTLPSCDGTRP